MKQRIVTYCALLMSLGSVCYAAWLHHKMRTVEQRTEAELVKNIEPIVREFFTGFGLAEDKFAKNPKTLAELLQPIQSEVHKVMGR